MLKYDNLQALGVIDAWLVCTLILCPSCFYQLMNTHLKSNKFENIDTQDRLGTKAKYLNCWGSVTFEPAFQASTSLANDDELNCALVSIQLLLLYKSLSGTTQSCFSCTVLQ